MSRIYIRFKWLKMSILPTHLKPQCAGGGRIPSKIVDHQLECFGWKTNLQQKRGTSKITISKPVAIGAGLEKGQELYCYLGKDRKERPIMVVYLDRKPRAAGQ